MKLSLVALPFLLLALTTASPGEFAQEMGIHDKSVLSGGLVGYCCKKNHKEKISYNLIERYFITDSNCRLISVVFVLKDGNTYCVDRDLQWAKIFTKCLDRKNPTCSKHTAVPTPSA